MMVTVSNMFYLRTEKMLLLAVSLVCIQVGEAQDSLTILSYDREIEVGKSGSLTVRYSTSSDTDVLIMSFKGPGGTTVQQTSTAISGGVTDKQQTVYFDTTGGDIGTGYFVYMYISPNSFGNRYSHAHVVQHKCRHHKCRHCVYTSYDIMICMLCHT